MWSRLSRVFAGPPLEQEVDPLAGYKEEHLRRLALVRNKDLGEQGIYSLANAANNSTVRVFFTKGHFSPEHLIPGDTTTPNSLHRILTKTLAVTTGGDKNISTQLGRTRISNSQTGEIAGHPRDVEPGHPDALSPSERLFARKKIIASEATVVSYGGYGCEKTDYESPIKVIISSKAAPQFENDYLEYQHFILDPRQNAEQQLGTNFHKRYSGSKIIPAHSHVINSLTNTDTDDRYLKLKTNGSDHYITRSAENGSYNMTADQNNPNILLLDQKAYLCSLIEDFATELAAIDRMVAEKNRRDGTNKSGYFKATLAGTGFFARIEAMYNISSNLFPLIFKAYRYVLDNYKFANIGFVEFPLFGALAEDNFAREFASYIPKDGGIRVIQGVHTPGKGRGALDFTHVIARKDLIFCASNPADSNSLVGNELGYASVEAAMGNNSDIRISQVYLTNPELLELINHYAVAIDPNNCTTRIVDSQDVKLNPEPRQENFHGIRRAVGSTACKLLPSVNAGCDTAFIELGASEATMKLWFNSSAYAELLTETLLMEEYIPAICNNESFSNEYGEYNGCVIISGTANICRFIQIVCGYSSEHSDDLIREWDPVISSNIMKRILRKEKGISEEILADYHLTYRSDLMAILLVLNKLCFENSLPVISYDELFSTIDRIAAVKFASLPEVAANCLITSASACSTSMAADDSDVAMPSSVIIDESGTDIGSVDVVVLASLAEEGAATGTSGVDGDAPDEEKVSHIAFT